MIDLGAFSFVDLLDAIADRVAERIAERDHSLITQHDRRGLGRRRHIEAVRRRIAEGRAGAYIRGRDYLLTPAAVREELERGGPRRAGDAEHPTAAAARARRAAAAAATAAEAAELEALSRKLDAELAAVSRGATRKH